MLVIVTSGTCQKKKKKSERELFLTYLKKLYFSLYQYHCRGFYSLQWILVSVVFIPAEVKNSFSRRRINASGNFLDVCGWVNTMPWPWYIHEFFQCKYYFFPSQIHYIMSFISVLNYNRSEIVPYIRYFFIESMFFVVKRTNSHRNYNL